MVPLGRNIKGNDGVENYRHRYHCPGKVGTMNEAVFSGESLLIETMN